MRSKSLKYGIPEACLFYISLNMSYKISANKVKQKVHENEKGLRKQTFSIDTPNIRVRNIWS